MPKSHPQATIRSPAKRMRCEGSHTSSSRVLDAATAVCPSCGETRPHYTSNRAGSGLMAEHDRASRARKEDASPP